MQPPGNNGVYRTSRRIFHREDTLYELAAAATTAVVPAIAELYLTATVNREVHGSGRLYDVSGSGAVSTQPADQFGSLCLLICRDKCVLLRLGGFELQSLILCGEGCDLILGQEIQNSAGVGVLILQQVTGVAVHDVAQITEALCHVEVYAIDGALGSAAAIRDLSADVAEAALHTEEAVLQGVIQCVSAVCQSVGLLIQLGNQSLLVNSRPDICLGCAGNCAAIAAVTAAKTTHPPLPNMPNSRNRMIQAPQSPFPPNIPPLLRLPSVTAAMSESV